jgi:hypothetical protein
MGNDNNCEKPIQEQLVWQTCAALAIFKAFICNIWPKNNCRNKIYKYLDWLVSV